MRQIIRIMAFAFLVMLGSSLQNKASAQYSDEVTYQTFYDDLSPYGQWIEYPEYGYVWSPNVGPDFRPYSSDGHWVYSDDYEWVWVSDYEWGWAPFHYGRWFEDPNYGWLWMPGYEWAPAWVAWRTGGDYYGWAPLRPGISIGADFSLGNYYAPDDYWCFAPRRYITSPRIYDYCIDRRQNHNYINTTIIINNYNRGRNSFIGGPRRSEVESYSGRINSVRFRQSSRPGRNEFRNNEVTIYRPNVQRDDNRRFTPRNFNRFDRQPQNNDNRTGRNDNRTGRNDNGFRQPQINNENNNNRGNNQPTWRNNNDNRFRQPQVNNGNDNNRGNNLPTRRENNDNGFRQPQVNNGNNTEVPRRNGSFDRRDNNNRQPARTNDVRVPDQPVRQVTPQNNPSNDWRGNRDNNRDSRNNNNPSFRQPQVRNDNNQRQPMRQVERQAPGRNFDRHDQGNRNQNNGRNGGKRRNG